MIRRSRFCSVGDIIETGDSLLTMGAVKIKDLIEVREMRPLQPLTRLFCCLKEIATGGQSSLGAGALFGLDNQHSNFFHRCEAMREAPNLV